MPVVSGNVSFYNETDGKGILPTPTIGMVGLICDTRKIITHGFKTEGDIIAVLGVTKDDLAASEYAQTILGHTTDELIAAGDVPHIDLAAEKLVQDTLLKLSEELLLASAHDCSDGGLAVAIAESCFSSLGRAAIGAEIDLTSNSLTNETLLFGESPSRIVISYRADNAEKVKTIVGECAFTEIGKVVGDSLSIAIDNGNAVTARIDDLESAWIDSLRSRLEN